METPSILELISSSAQHTKELLQASEYGRQLIQLADINDSLQQAALCLRIPPTASVLDVTRLFSQSIDCDHTTRVVSPAKPRTRQAPSQLK